MFHFCVPAFVYCHNLVCDMVTAIFSPLWDQRKAHVCQPVSCASQNQCHRKRTVGSVYLDPRSELFQLSSPWPMLFHFQLEGRHQLFAVVKWAWPGAGKVSCLVLALPFITRLPLPASFHSSIKPVLQKELKLGGTLETRASQMRFTCCLKTLHQILWRK